MYPSSSLASNAAPPKPSTTCTAATLPERAAIISAVVPSLLFAAVSHPARASIAMHPASPLKHA